VADRDMTVIISSHNLHDLENVCDCIGILHQGVMLIQKALDDLKTDVHKIQIAFTEGIPLLLLQNVPLLYREERGSVLILIARGSHDELIEHIRSYNPAIVDILPLTLEEIFIYEMGDNGYEIKNILY
jgi:ABC-2 type transport system ATP-binding protein